ncbi:hypothetical protein HYX11_01795 [Candidatus Woesearchaeota archaeon]|nr:hypothetical protein [Candidatus Woesearchaeota archaeon]
MNKQIQYKEFRINDLSELLEAKNPKGVLILEGNLGTWKDDGSKEGNEGSLTKTWKEAIDYTSGVCDKLSIPYIRVERKAFQWIAQLENDNLRRIIEWGITSQADLGLYIAGCLCCVETGTRDTPLDPSRPAFSRGLPDDSQNSFLSDLRQLKNLFGLDRVFIASSQKGQNAPRGYVTNMPKDGYFLV